jgi:hypothetical protein
MQPIEVPDSQDRTDELALQRCRPSYHLQC